MAANCKSPGAKVMKNNDNKSSERDLEQERKILEEFANKYLLSLKDLPADYSKMVSDNFWDLI